MPMTHLEVCHVKKTMARNSIRCMLAVLVVATTWLTNAHAADQAKKERCTRYAQRAVEQYNLMQSHPECRVNDDLNWHGSLDGHYNGCMLIPEAMSRAGEASRDNHLQACGAFSAASAPPTTSTAVGPAPGPSTSADPSKVAVGSGAAQVIAPSGPEMNCQPKAPASLQ